jgi:hypothetical protein
MLGKTVTYFALSLFLLLSNGSGDPMSRQGSGTSEQIAILDRMIVATGNVKIDLSLDPLNRLQRETETMKLESFRFDVSPNSFFTISVLNDSLRSIEPGSIGLIWDYSRILPESLRASSNQLVIEKVPSNQRFSLFVRDGQTGFHFFNIEATLTEYDAAALSLSIKGRLFISEDLASSLGRLSDADALVGEISIATKMYQVETTTLVNGVPKSATLVPRKGGASTRSDAPVPGPILSSAIFPAWCKRGALPGRSG